MPHPYSAAPARAFWRSAVAERPGGQIDGLWSPAFRVGPRDAFVTYGSCFAQHVSRALQAAGRPWLDAEPAPAAIPRDVREAFGYGVFSARTQNIYTTKMLDQWMSWALDNAPVPTETWSDQGSFFDPFRPTVEPDGFLDEEHLLMARETTLDSIRDSIQRGRVLVYTLGLTEAWLNAGGGYAYASCPGTVRGRFVPSEHLFANLDYTRVRSDLESAISRIRGVNASMKIILTVSPVPLTATATSQHVIAATTYSKSVLRAVAGDVSASLPEVDYFPAYEYFTSPVFRGDFYEQGLRRVSRAGVDHVMRAFLAGVGVEEASITEGSSRADESPASSADALCEDVLLDAAAPRES